MRYPDDHCSSQEEPMTCVIGVRYGSGQGSAVISDSRLMMGGDYFSDQKCFEVADGIVFSSSGYSG